MGGIDGSITTFAIVAASAGAHLESVFIIILGLANLIADGFSMSIGSYLSTQSESDHYNKHLREEKWEVEFNPDEGRAEIREIYSKKGFSGDLLDQIVNKIVENKDLWISTMMREEHNLIPDRKSAVSRASVTFISFIIVGFIPLLVYVADLIKPLHIDLFLWASILTGIAFILIGILKSYVTESKMIQSVFQTFLLGLVAALIAYYTGSFLEQLLG